MDDVKGVKTNGDADVRLAIVAADPLAAIIAAVVRGTDLENVPPACAGTCGSWEILKENNANSSGEFAISELTAMRHH